MTDKSEKLLEAMQDAGPEDSTFYYESDPDIGLMFRMRCVDSNGQNVCSVFCQYDEPSFIFNTITVEEEYQQSGILKDMCKVIPKFCRANGFTQVFVPSITSSVTLATLSNNGFEQNESGNWVADISNPNNAVEAYGNS